MASPIKTKRVYNRSPQRTFIHDHGDKTYRVVPSSFADLPEPVADLLLRDYPKEIVEAGVAHKEIGGVHAELAETKSQLSAKDARIAELEAALKAKAKGDI